MIKVIAGMGVVIALLTFGLYKQVQAYGELSSDFDHVVEINQRNLERLAKQEQLRKQAELLVAGLTKRKQELEAERIETRETIKEIVINAPPEDCIHQPPPAGVLACLQSDGCN